MTTTIRFLGTVYCLGAAALCAAVALMTDDLTATFTLSSLAVTCFYGASNLATEKW